MRSKVRLETQLYQPGCFELCPALVILIPVVGGLAVVFLVRAFAPEARGHGVPEIMRGHCRRENRPRE